MTTPATLAGLLRSSAESGHFEQLASVYAEGAVLDASVPGARHTLRGRGEIAAGLARLLPGGGRVVDWDAAVYDHGLAVWLERVGDGGEALRQRHYLRLADGEVERHWLYSARPRATEPAAPLPESAEELFAGLGRVVERSTLASSGWSGNRIDRLRMEDGRTLIAKRIVPGADWLGRVTGDDGREARLFCDGVFARMPDVVDPAVVAAERDGEAWWVVMRDVSHELLDADSPLSRDENRFVLGAAAAMWDRFWDEPVPHLSSQLGRLSAAGPRVWDRERHAPDILPKQFEAAWEAFAAAVEGDVGDAVLRLVAEPEPLAAALEDRGLTLTHGDLRDENIGLPGGRLVLLDFGLATAGHPASEFAWYMVHDVWRIAASHDEVVEDFRAAMGERDDRLALDLGMISGLVQYGWIFGHSAVVHPDPEEREWARAELDWWVPRVRRALEEWR